MLHRVIRLPPGFLESNLQSDRKIENQSHLDWLPILDRFIPEMLQSGIVHTKEDIKNIRVTCKLFKAFADPYFTKYLIYLELGRLPDKHAVALAASPLLKHIRKLELLYYPETDEFGRLIVPEFSKLHLDSILSILKQCAPNLTELRVWSSPKATEFSLPRSVIGQGIQFPALKSFSMFPCGDISAPALQPSLFSMTSLESLFFPHNRQDSGSYTDLEQIGLITQAPFLDNLVELHLSLQEDEGEDENPDYDEPLELLLTRCHNLKIFKLAYILPEVDETVVNGLDELTLYDCIDIDSLPRCLIHLNLEFCEFSSPEVFFDMFTSGNFFTRLKTLKMNKVEIEDDDDNECWRGFMERLKLPMVESIDIEKCRCLSLTDVFCISEAAPNLPRLVLFRAEIGSEHYESPVESPELVFYANRFFTSSLAANLETLGIRNVRLEPDVLAELTENAVKMKKIKRLEIRIKEPQIELIAVAGSRGGWPMLKEIILDIRPTEEEMEDGEEEEEDDPNDPDGMDEYYRNKPESDRLTNMLFKSWPRGLHITT